MYTSAFCQLIVLFSHGNWKWQITIKKMKYKNGVCLYELWVMTVNHQSLNRQYRFIFVWCFFYCIQINSNVTKTFALMDFLPDITHCIQAIKATHTHLQINRARNSLSLFDRLKKYINHSTQFLSPILCDIICYDGLNGLIFHMQIKQSINLNLFFYYGVS